MRYALVGVAGVVAGVVAVLLAASPGGAAAPAADPGKQYSVEVGQGTAYYFELHGVPCITVETARGSGGTTCRWADAR
jgi:hypothetical protein